MMKRFLALLLCAVTLLTCFVGCASDDDEKDEDKGQYITAYLTNNVYDLDPAHAYTNEALTQVVGLLFDTLFKLDKNGKVKASLAEKYTIVENDNTGEYIMNIWLKDTNWSDGTAVSGNDVVFTFKRLLEVDASYEAAALLFDIKNARAAKEGDASIDDVGVCAPETKMVEIRFEKSIDYDQFMLNLCSLALAPLRSDVVAKSDDWAKKAGTMVTSGPYKLSRVDLITDKSVKYEDVNWSEIATDEDKNPVINYGDGTETRTSSKTTIASFMLERNAYYYRDAEEDGIKDSVKPYKICVDCSLTPEQLTAQIENGMMLYVGDVPLVLRKDSAVKFEVNEQSMSTNALFFNENAMIDDGTEEGSALFADAKVRQALSLAIDRQAIADIVVYADAATGLIPTAVLETGADRKATFRSKCSTEYEFLKNDMSKAQSLLSEAGIKPSKYSFTLTVAEYDDVHNAIAEEIVKAWNELGFKVTLNSRGTIINNDYYKYTESVPADICDDLFSEALRTNAYEAILFDYCTYSMDPYGMLAPFALKFSGMAMDMSDPNSYIIPTHSTGYHNEEYDALMEEIFAEKVIANRAENLRKAEGILMNDLPIVPIIFNKTATYMSSKLKNVDTTVTLNANFRNAKVSGYTKLMEVGKKWLADNFDELTFNDFEECAFAEYDAFKEANTIYAQYYLAEKEAAKKAAAEAASKK
ncbi:MAG: ABC transporter substrate-binding protein [Clostridia bacterium]|nr:ABC transporter substrate-binding protein [Clostridia bacterium]